MTEPLVRVPKTRRRYFTGVVVSDKMDKTVVVVSQRRTLHPVYKKYVMVSKRMKAHDANNLASIGDTVRLVESRPISKDKCWRVVEILQSGEDR